MYAFLRNLFKQKAGRGELKWNKIKERKEDKKLFCNCVDDGEEIFILPKLMLFNAPPTPGLREMQIQ